MCVEVIVCYIIVVFLKHGVHGGIPPEVPVCPH